MCLAKPGPRCSGHTLVRIEKLDQSIEKTNKNLAQEVYRARALKAQAKQNPQDAKVVAQYQKSVESVKTLKKRSEDQSASLKRQKVIYDGTHRGQNELKEKLKTAVAKGGDNANAIMEITDRISKGRTDYFLRKHRYDLVQKRKETNKSLHERRGKFLTMEGRENDEIVESSDLLAVA